MSTTQADRVESLRCLAVDYVRSDEDEPGKFVAELTALVTENDELRADARRATALVDAVRQFRCERVLERAAALRQTLGYCALVDAWEDCADAGMGTEPGRAGAASNTTQQQGG